MGASAYLYFDQRPERIGFLHVSICLAYDRNDRRYKWTQEMIPRSFSNDGKQTEHKGRFTKNVFFSAGQWIVQLSVGLYMLGYVVSQLGQEQWGLVVLAMSLSTYLSLIQAGASVGISKKLNESYTKENFHTFRCYYTLATLLCVVLSAIIVIATALIMMFFWSEVGIPDRYAQEGKLVLGGAIASTVCMVLSLPMVGCLQSIHRSDINSSVQAWSVILRAVGVIAVFESLGPSASAYIVVYLAASIFTLLWLYWWVYTNMPAARTTTHGLGRSQLIDLIAINGATFFNTVSYVLFMQGPVLLYRENLGFVGLYGVGLQINNLVRGLFFSPFSALSSVMVSLKSTDNIEDIRGWFAIATKVYVAMAVMIWLWFVVLGPSVLRLWIQSGINVEMLAGALPYLVGVTAMGIISMPSSAVEVALGRLHITALTGVGLVAALTAALLVFVPVHSGDLIVSVNALVVIFFGLWQLIIMLRVGLSLQYNSLHGVTCLVFRPCLSAIMASIPLIIIQKVYHPNEALPLALLTGLAGLSFVVMFFLAGLNATEREKSRVVVMEFLSRG